MDLPSNPIPPTEATLNYTSNAIKPHPYRHLAVSTDSIWPKSSDTQPQKPIKHTLYHAQLIHDAINTEFAKEIYRAFPLSPFCYLLCHPHSVPHGNMQLNLSKIYSHVNKHPISKRRQTLSTYKLKEPMIWKLGTKQASILNTFSMTQHLPQ